VPQLRQLDGVQLMKTTALFQALGHAPTALQWRIGLSVAGLITCVAGLVFTIQWLHQASAAVATGTVVTIGSAWPVLLALFVAIACAVVERVLRRYDKPAAQSAGGTQAP
jgi:hypothetical protein